MGFQQVPSILNRLMPDNAIIPLNSAIRQTPDQNHDPINQKLEGIAHRIGLTLVEGGTPIFLRQRAIFVEVLKSLGVPDENLRAVNSASNTIGLLRGLMATNLRKSNLPKFFLLLTQRLRDLETKPSSAIQVQAQGLEVKRQNSNEIAKPEKYQMTNLDTFLAEIHQSLNLPVVTDLILITTLIGYFKQALENLGRPTLMSELLGTTNSNDLINFVFSVMLGGDKAIFTRETETADKAQRLAQRKSRIIKELKRIIPQSFIDEAKSKIEVVEPTKVEANPVVSAVTKAQLEEGADAIPDLSSNQIAMMSDVIRFSFPVCAESNELLGNPNSEPYIGATPIFDKLVQLFGEMLRTEADREKLKLILASEPPLSLRDSYIKLISFYAYKSGGFGKALHQLMIDFNTNRQNELRTVKPYVVTAQILEPVNSTKVDTEKLIQPTHTETTPVRKAGSITILGLGEEG